MLHYGYYNMDISGPLTQYEDVPEIQLWCRVTATTSQSHIDFPQTRRFGVCSFNANEEERGGSRRRVKEEGGGVALSSLRPRYHAHCLQWIYRKGKAHTAFGRVL